MWSVLITPLWTALAYFYYYVRITVIYHIYFVVIESFGLRLLVDRVWKRPPPLNDEFFSVFLTIVNFVLGFWLCNQQLATWERGPIIYRITGQLPADWPAAKLRLRSDWLTFSLAFLSAFAYFSLRAFHHLKRWVKAWSAVAPVAGPTVPTISQNVNMAGLIGIPLAPSAPR